jgi:hypothetical protein
VPAKGFADLEAARIWAASFVRWHNHENRHGGIRYLGPTPAHLSASMALRLCVRTHRALRMEGDNRNYD